LFVVPEISENTRRATANLKDVKVVTPLHVNVVDLLKYGQVAISDKAVKMLEEVLVK
jgi:ribosomal protein L4